MNKVQTGVLGVIVALGFTTVVVETRATLDLQREIDTTRHALSENSPPTDAITPPIAAPDSATTAELARLRARMAELKSRPDGVVDSEIIPRPAWKNFGRATPEAALETLTWAFTTHNYDELAKATFYGDKTKAEADAIFASLSPDLQVKYGTPERLLAPFVFAAPSNQPWVERLDSIQVIDLLGGDSPDQVKVRYWCHFSDGTAQVETLPFKRFGNEWRMGARPMGYTLPKVTPEFIRKVSDPANFPAANGTQ